MGAKIVVGRIKPKRESTFGVKKPFKGTCKNRKGNLKVNSSRLKPKYNAKNKKKFTFADARYMGYLQSLNEVCFCCGEQNGIEWHHVKLYSTDDKDHTRLIPLCGVKCHRLGVVLSAHGTPKKWRETFSMEAQLDYAAKIYENYKKEIEL